MTENFDGGLGTSVTLTASDSTTNIGVDATVGFVVPNSEGASEAPTDEIVTLQTEEVAKNALGESTEAYRAYEAAKAMGTTSLVAYTVGTEGSMSTAVEALAGVARFVVPLTEDDQKVQDALAGAAAAANGLEFTRIVAPGNDTAPADAGSLTPAQKDYRLVKVEPLRANVRGIDTYTAVAVAVEAAQQELGDSITYDQLPVSDLSTEYGRAVAQSFENVTAVTRDGVIAEGITTSDKEAFRDIYAVEIVDAVVLALDAIGQNFAGEVPNTPAGRRSLETEVDSVLGPLTQRRPPLLSTVTGEPAFTRSATAVGGSNEVRLAVTVSPVDVMKQINIELDVGSVVTPVTIEQAPA
jgi:hypothetical protein